MATRDCLSLKQKMATRDCLSLVFQRSCMGSNPTVAKHIFQASLPGVDIHSE